MSDAAGPTWLFKGVRTLLSAAPGLLYFVVAGDERGVALAFAALCLSVPYNDPTFRPRHLAGAAVASAVLMPIFPWLHRRPALYVVVLAAAGVVYVLVSRAGRLPPRVPIWVTVYVLYQSSELAAAPWPTIATASLLVVPAAAWAYLVCFWLCPARATATVLPAAPDATGEMGVGAHATCVALALASAAAATFALRLPDPNWTIWSALTVIRPGRAVSLRRSAERLAGAVIGASLGISAVLLLAPVPRALAGLTVLLVFFMVAFEQYTLAVAVRSALAPLAVFALHGDAVAAGAARFGCIFVGVCIGAAFLLAVNRAAGRPRVLTARRF